MAQILAALSNVPEFAIPLEFSIAESASQQGASTRTHFQTIPLVTNAVSQVFGEVVILDRGAIWVIPQFLDNARFCVTLLDQFDAFLAIQSSLRASATVADGDGDTSSPKTTAVRDVFISHASEDKDVIARPLYQALVAHGVSVWFDEAVLELGDSLRRKIDEGLAKCRYGVVILSPRFLEKEWPQRELDGLVARETASGEKAILPIWHELDRGTLMRYSPPLADRLAGRSEEGIPALVDKVLRVLRK
jgi:hypothetical protein